MEQLSPYGQKGGQPRLLVVDDEPGLRELVRLAMETRGWRVAEAANADAAEQALHPVPPDVVLLDLKLPGAGGEHWLAEVRRRGHRFPVVVISGADDVPERARRLGVRFLAKPFRIADLVQVVEQALSPPR